MLKKGLLVIAVPFLFQIAFIAALWKARTDSETAQFWAIHTKDVIARTEAVSRFVTEAQNEVRGRIVTGEASRSSAYARAAGRIPGALERLRRLVSDNPRQETRAIALRAKIGRFMARLDKVHRLAVAGSTKEASDQVRVLLEERAADSIREDVDAFLAEEERYDVIRRARLARTGGRQNAAIVGGAAVSVAAAVVLTLVFSRGFARRLAVLGENARRLAAGESLAAPIGGGDEISRLDSLFHVMAASLAEKDRENEMFIYSVSHDLRSPLVNLQGFSKELTLTSDDLRAALARGSVPVETLRRIDVLLDRDMAASIQFIQSAVTRLSAIIDALLRLSRAGRVEYRRQPIDVAAAVARVAQALRSTIVERGAEVVVGDLPPAWGDPTAVEQVFANLIDNALNYLDPARPGRVEIGAAGSESAPAGGKIGAGGKTGAGLITYHVKDNGMGIPRAYHSKIFMAFQRLHPDAAEGEGVGLALVRRVVERHGGTIWFDSDEGQGSTFHFTLRASPPSGNGSAERVDVEAGRSAAGAEGMRR